MKKKLLTLGLSSTLALSSIMPAFADTISSGDTGAKDAYIQTNIGFKYPETVEQLREKNLTVSLTDNNNQVLSIDLTNILSTSSGTTTLDNIDIRHEVVEEDGKVKLIKLTIPNLTPSENYKLTIDGDKYVKVVEELNTKTFSKKVNVNMFIGDVNNDGEINLQDRELLEENLNNDSTYDLTGDGKITISDIAIVNHNISRGPSPQQFDLDIVPSSVSVKELPEDSNITIEEGANLNDIFIPGKSVTFKAKDEGKNDPLTIPLELDTPQKLSEVSVNVPQGENVKVTVLTDDGEFTNDSNTPAVATYARTGENQNNTVVVNLGSRKPVKKITITVTPTENGEVVVSDVKLIGDIASEDSIPDTAIKGLKATAGDAKVDLTWTEDSNATGYKVYYGESIDKLEKTTTTDSNNITIDGLTNFTTYYFAVAATNNAGGNEWEGEKSEIVSATPQALSKPLKPDFVTAKGGDGHIKLSWKASENAKSYNVYAKAKNESDYKKVGSGITGTDYTVSNLINGTEYALYVTAQNDAGESPASEIVNAVPSKQEIIPPTLPTLDRIPNDNIESVKLSHPDHYSPTLYPDGFDTNWFIDNNFNTTWVARRWYDHSSITFTFNQPKDMNYLVWVPRLDGAYKNGNFIETAYRDSFDRYHIEVWTEGQDLTKPGTMVAKDKKITNRVGKNDYFVFDFPKQEKVKQIRVQPIQWDGSHTDMNASEVAFYEYNDIGDRVANLFANQSRTELKGTVTIDEINQLKEKVNTADGFVVDKSILLKELDIATSLKNGDTKNLGVIKDNVFSINPSLDSENHKKAINNWQPLGVVGLAGEKVTIFADIPEGETVSLVPTQYFEEATKLSAAPITLQNGRNTITIPKIGDNYYDRGGSLYITYNGKNADKIKLQVIGGYDIPYLELSDFHNINETEAKKRIKTFIEELVAYDPWNLPGNKEIQNRNQTEIALPNVLLSLPATKVLDGIKNGTQTIDEQVEKLYQNCLAWEQVMDIVYKTYGIQDTKTGLETRHNIRYMKMFANAFMYASGNHIGVGYESVSPLMNGKPVTSGQKEANSLFGWGIAHEIGHVMDNLGKAEVTNNIYSLMVQTYDGENNILPSRLEGSGFAGSAYEKAFNKVAIGDKGVPNDVFVQLVMYWQLHLAYDGAGENAFDFYNKLQAQNRDKDLKDMDNFAIAASEVTGKNLTEFFTRWGVDLKEETIKKLESKTAENRAIYYLTDESRRQRLASTGENKNIEATPKAEINADNPKEVNITITPTGTQQNVQGYEILRKASGKYKGIGFAKADENGNATFTDVIGSANNLTFQYKIVPIDILGNKSEATETEQIRISYDNVVESNKYNIEDNKVTFTDPTIVTGIKITKKSEALPTGTVEIKGKINNEVNGTPEAEEVTVKTIDFSNANDNYAKDKSTTYLTYFNKAGASADKITPYELTELTLPAEIDTTKYTVEFLAYPGDNVEFMTMGIGRLGNDYTYEDAEGKTQTIKQGTLIFMGNYRANSIASTVYIKGKYPNNNSLNENITTSEKLVEGYGLMLDTVDENGKITASTADGIFIYVPNIQNDGQNSEENKDPEKISSLPNEIKAEIWQGEYSTGRLTSDTLWVPMPSEESLPTIILQQNKNGGAPKIEIR